MLKRLLLTCGLALALVPAAFAGSPSSSATVGASVDPIVLDAPFTWSGCGYKPGQLLRLQTSGLTTTGEYEFADASGCFVSSLWMLSSVFVTPGIEVASIFDASNGKPKTRALATASFAVVSAP